MKKPRFSDDPVGAYMAERHRRETRSFLGRALDAAKPLALQFLPERHRLNHRLHKQSYAAMHARCTKLEKDTRLSFSERPDVLAQILREGVTCGNKMLMRPQQLAALMGRPLDQKSRYDSSIRYTPEKPIDNGTTYGTSVGLRLSTETQKRGTTFPHRGRLLREEKNVAHKTKSELTRPPEIDPREVARKLTPEEHAAREAAQHLFVKKVFGLGRAA